MFFFGTLKYYNNDKIIHLQHVKWISYIIAKISVNKIVHCTGQKIEKASTCNILKLQIYIKECTFGI